MAGFPFSQLWVNLVSSTGGTLQWSTKCIWNISPALQLAAEWAWFWRPQWCQLWPGTRTWRRDRDAQSHLWDALSNTWEWILSAIFPFFVSPSVSQEWLKPSMVSHWSEGRVTLSSCAMAVFQGDGQATAEPSNASPAHWPHSCLRLPGSQALPCCSCPLGLTTGKWGAGVQCELVFS